MNDTCDLTQKKCTPCQGGTPPLGEEARDTLLKQLKPEWQINAHGHLDRTYTFSNFLKPLAFANQIAVIAEAEGHHPDLSISWGKCGIEIWTHKIDGLSESDFILAAKIDALKDAD